MKSYVRAEAATGTSALRDVHTHPAGARERPKRSVASWRTLSLEVLTVLASPAVLFWILRLRAMAPVQQSDPSMHSTFIFNPEGLFSRFGGNLSPETIGDSARAGFLVPARVFYLLFGAVPGFFVYRYVLSLVAIIPVYLLLRRLYGRWAGWVGIIVVMSSPVVVATWGSDYASSAAISYLIGGIAALALSLEALRWAKLWLLGACILFTMSVWTNAICLLIVAPALVTYLVLRLRRDRRLLGWDVLAAGGAALLTTAFLALLSKLLLGWSDFILVTIRAARAQTTPEQLRLFHSTSWAWAPYDPYLLVLPAVVIAYLAVFARRGGIRSSILLVGIAGALQVPLFAYPQFFGHLPLLEQPLFSCFLWSSTNLMLALILAESMSSWTGTDADSRTGRPTVASQTLRVAAMSVPALIVLGVPIAYEAAPQAPPMTWAPWGYILALIVIAAAGVARLTVGWARPAVHDRIRRTARWVSPLAAGSVIVITGATLLLTAAPIAFHQAPRNTSWYNPVADYSSVLGGPSQQYVEEYRVNSELAAFVGKPEYRGEELLMWSDRSQWYYLLGPLGLYDSVTNLLQGSFPLLDPIEQGQINQRRPGQILLMTPDGKGFDQAVQSLSSYGPVVVRRATLGNDLYHLHVWLVDLTRYDRLARH